MRKIFFSLVIFIIIFYLGKRLLPSNIVFDYHDSTQPARVKEFTSSLLKGRVPPRIAANFSFNLGYPVFNYYAPTAYWISSVIHLLGFDPINSVKISFLLATVIAFVGMYLLGNKLIGYPAGLIAGSLLASSPWMASQIFIRGDLAEIWFIALFPLTLYLLKLNSNKKSDRFIFLITVVITSLTLTSHNLLSLIGSGFLAIYIFVVGKNLFRNYLAFFMSFLLAGYFFLPALTELKFTHAVDIASGSSPYSSFLCLKQLWSGAWGYGGSVGGCENDGMAFMVGKLMIVMASLGVFWAILNYKKLKGRIIFIFFLTLSVFSIFMTLSQSSFIWKLTDPYSKIFQFSWRFLDFVIIFLSLLAGYLVINNKNVLVKAGLVILVTVNIFYNTKFFTKFPMSLVKLKQDILTQDYLTTSVVYYVPEYLPTTVSYNDWLEYQPKKTPYKIDEYVGKGPVVSKEFLPVNTVKDTFYEKEAKTLLKGTYLINIHYLPYWKISINNNEFIPKKFDSLGRPIIRLDAPSTIKIKYRQTPVEIGGNVITVLTLTALLLILIDKNIWKKMKV